MNSTFPRPATRPRKTPEGQWLYRERMRRGLRQSDVAIYLGRINPGRISEYEQGLRPIPRDLKVKLQQPRWV